MRKILAFCITAILFAGCNFKPETPQISANFKADFNSSNINDFWWKNFNDENLNMLIDSALKNNSDLALALNNIEYARVSLGLSKLEFLPNFTLSGSAVRQNNFPQAPDSNHANIYQIGAGLNYELDLWGKVRNSVDAAGSNFKATVYDYDNARLSIASSVANLYFKFLSLKEQEKILTQTLAAYEQMANFRANQLKAGAINNIVYYQSKAQVQSATASLIATKTQINATKTALSIMTGKNYDEILHNNIKASQTFPTLPEIPAGIPSDLLLHRADVASALERLKATNFLVGAQKANYFPSFSLTGAFGFASTEFDRLFVNNASSWNIGGSLIGPLLDFGRTKKRIDLANLDQNASFINYDKTLKTAFGDVRDALVSVKNSDLRTKTLKDLLATQQQVYNAAKLRYDSGYSDHIELLDSERNLLSAKLNLSMANYERYASEVALYKALGGGFSLKDSKTVNLINTNKTVMPNDSAFPVDKRIF